MVSHLPSNPIGVVVVAAVLLGLSIPLIRWVADKERSPWLVRILVISLLLHLLAAPAQIFVVNHFYHGVADWIRYDNQGSILAPSFRSLDFTLAGANVRGIVNDGSVSIAAGIVMAIVGVNQLATFFVFAWLSFVGSIFFYRAFTLTFAGAEARFRRYAYLVFFLPSTLFWTADVSKEAIMTLSLGLVAYGLARVLVRAPGGFRIAVVGIAVGGFIRPNELVVVLGGFAVALIIRPQIPGVRDSTLKRVGGLAFMVLLLIGSAVVTVHYLHLGSTSGGLSLSSISKRNQGAGGGFGSSGLSYHSNPVFWPVDAYHVLFDPLGFNAHGAGEFAASGENLLILAIAIASYRQLRILPRAAFARPYVMMCTVYCIGFIYAFAALGNLGLIYRERALLLPFLMVLFAIPRTPRHRVPVYEWEYRRKDRARFRMAMLQRERVLRARRREYVEAVTRRSAAPRPVPALAAAGPPGPVPGPGRPPTTG